MASAFAHVFAAASLGAAITPGRWLPRVLVVAIVCSLLPDADVFGFALGIKYGDLLGHRGLSHGLAFAAVTAGIAAPLCFRGPAWRGLRIRIGVFLFVIVASHGLFDAMTNGGLGVAFFSPFDDTRYFLPYRPVEVSPIGIRSFFTARALPLLWTELVWIGLPWSGLTLVVWHVMRRVDSA